MSLTLENAALLAKLSPEDLTIEINKGSLVAVESDGNFIIEEYDLDAFLKKKSFDALWSENGSQEDELEDTPRGSSMTGNLRRVLTAEAVSELKIQHQVLISRVQTLERLFSEFMDAEKDAENTLVLEDDWKITEVAGQSETSSPVPVSIEDLAKAATQDNTSADVAIGAVSHETQQSEAEQESGSGELSLQSNRAARRAYQLQTAKEAHNPNKNTSGSNVLDEADELKGHSEKATAKSAKDLLAMKLKMMEADKAAPDSEDQARKIDTIEEFDESQQDADNDDDVGSGIAERLQEYEKRLAQAKQTATQIWH